MGRLETPMAVGTVGGASRVTRPLVHASKSSASMPQIALQPS